MEPYTSEGLESRDTAIQQSPSPMTMEPPMMSSGMGGGSGDEKQVAGLTISSMTSSRIIYELVGVVVHSGQANAGHYYSFIKERRDNYLTNANYGKWYKFNDAFVEEFDMNESTLESECFGGKYKAKAYDNCK
jgi:ubiquitin carboxyl-terminal hydrolase 9/24